MRFFRKKFKSNYDPNGSYTGSPTNSSDDKPVQDVDDL